MLSWLQQLWSEVDPTISMLSLRDFKHHISGTSSEFLQGYDNLLQILCIAAQTGSSTPGIFYGLASFCLGSVGKSHGLLVNFRACPRAVKLVVGLLNWLVRLFSVKYLYL